MYHIFTITQIGTGLWEWGGASRLPGRAEDWRGTEKASHFVATYSRTSCIARGELQRIPTFSRFLSVALCGCACIRKCTCTRWGRNVKRHLRLRIGSDDVSRLFLFLLLHCHDRVARPDNDFAGLLIDFHSSVLAAANLDLGITERARVSNGF
jgi:hypothetical protein